VASQSVSQSGRWLVTKAAIWPPNDTVLWHETSDGTVIILRCTQ
jgi:hypothetical protein